MIGLKNSRHSLNQSDAKLKLVSTWSPAFSRALGDLVGCTLSSYWPRSIFLLSDWSLWFFWFWFYDTQSESALSKQFCDPHWGSSIISSIILCHWTVTLDGTKLATDLMCFVCSDTDTVALGWTLEETPWKDFDPSAVKRLFVLSSAYESSSETMDFQSRIPELRTTFASPSGADEVLQ